MNCPKCNTPLDPALIRREAARLAGRVKSLAKARSSRANGRKGGRPLRDHEAPGRPAARTGA